MKIAIVGKGGTGKTFVAASLARMYARQAKYNEQPNVEGRQAQRTHMVDQMYGMRTKRIDQVYAMRTHMVDQVYDMRTKKIDQVYALDTDPLCGLGAALGLSKHDIEKTKPIIDMREFIEPNKEDGSLYLSTPDAGSIGGQYSTLANGVNFLRMANIKKAGAGCYCSEYAFLQALIKSMLLTDDDVLILDMCAGIEHLTRGVIKGVDIMLIVSEATRACIEATKAIQKLGADLGIPHIYIVANKIHSEKEELLIRANFHRDVLIGLIHMSETVTDHSIGIGVHAYASAEKGIGSDADAYAKQNAFTVNSEFTDKDALADIEALFRRLQAIS